MLYPGGGAEACSNETDFSGAVENRLKSRAFLLKKEVRRNDVSNERFALESRYLLVLEWLMGKGIRCFHLPQLGADWNSSPD